MTGWKYITPVLALLAGLSLISAVPSALAASPQKDDGQGAAEDLKDKNAEPKPGDANYIPKASTNMPMLLVPVMVDGRRSHYIFVSYRLVMHNELQVDTVNQRIAWLHDRFIREVFTTNPVDPDNSNRLDRELIKRRFKEIGKEVLHDDLIKDVYFSSVHSEKEPIRAAPRRFRGQDIPGPATDRGGH